MMVCHENRTSGPGHPTPRCWVGFVSQLSLLVALSSAQPLAAPWQGWMQSLFTGLRVWSGMASDPIISRNKKTECKP
ncbi:hypothetical protein SODALDRAFT_17600 [Sodiomyces alkalinus F11]|uniref:Uncharacterized protein n=1 Tax=Sodiomyces alkalinus (strain CBS 110278 / VKM F-3762 / F11) TaxID=1314773 RepID=A0A3N2Q760_SODAK|nr:hypothetical protein SODALDRAFT_17600 [Sodiomyces alkalinus F11]ROT42527.1 hypothetical protein SODALDRAFT_17600 [Sodiomyces alkalinus F11]